MEKRNKTIITIAAVLIAVTAAAVIATVVIQASPANRANRKLRLAQKYLNEMNYEQAVLTYMKAIAIDPKCEAAYLAAADIYMKTGEEERAVEILEKARQNIGNDTIAARLEEARAQAASAMQAKEDKERQTEPVTQAPTQSPTQTPTEAPTEPPAPASGIAPANAGEIITFGTYEQDGDTSNGAEPIEWLVLDNQGDNMLVISRYGLDCQRYNETAVNVTWETCTLRSWLNSEFYNMAFSEGEKASILMTTLDNPNNTKYGTSGGSATQDKVFCLSLDEANRYFGADDWNGENRARAAKPMPYAVSRGVDVNTSTQWYGGNCWWWLRSPGLDQYYAAFVNSTGGVIFGGDPVIFGSAAVRPALWIGF